MTRPRRWAVFGAVLAVLIALPFVVRVLPVGGSSESATALLARIRAAGSTPYQGYAESTGSLTLPAATTLDAVSSLLGDRTQVRVWWRTSTDWRADTLSATGEEDTYVTDTGTSLWDYEDSRVTQTPASAPGAVRFPRAADVLPPMLAARMLSEATASQLTTLAPRRVAGRPADGLRLRPADDLSSIDHVDVWADRASGVPVTVEVFGRAGTSGTASDVAAVSTTFLDFSPSEPTVAATTFDPPPGVRLRRGSRFDLVRLVGRVPDPGLPTTLVGLPRAPSQDGLEGIGQYGEGVTQAVVGDLPDDVAGSLRDQLKLAIGATQLPEGIAVNVGPLALLLTDPQTAGHSWLVSGTLSAQGLARAATQLKASSS